MNQPLPQSSLLSIRCLYASRHLERRDLALGPNAVRISRAPRSPGRRAGADLLRESRMFSRHLPVSEPPLSGVDEDELPPVATMDHPHGGPVSNSGPGNDMHSDHVTVAPPYWTSTHSRSASTVSYQSLNDVRPAAILLEDHSEESCQQTRSCWAQSVSIDEYVIVSGPTGVGAYVVWACTVSTLKGGDLSLRKRSLAELFPAVCISNRCHRYSEFDRLRVELCKAFPHAKAMIPVLPRKSHISRFRPRFLEHRKNGLQHFLK